MIELSQKGVMILDGIISIIFLLFAGAILFGIIYSVSQNTHRITKEALKSLPDSFEILENVKVVDDKKSSFIIDYTVMSKKGIYLLKIVDRKGIITGDESQPKWKEDLKSVVEEFDNPITEVVEFIIGIRNELDDIATEIPIYPMVVFPNKANIDNLYSDALVIRANEIINLIKSDKETMTKEQLESAMERLVPKSQKRIRAA